MKVVMLDKFGDFGGYTSFSDTDMSKENVCNDYKYHTCHAGKFWKAVLSLMATITAPDSAIRPFTIFGE